MSEVRKNEEYNETRKQTVTVVISFFNLFLIFAFLVLVVRPHVFKQI